MEIINARTMVDQFRSMEQDVFPIEPLAARGRHPNPSNDVGSNRDVLPLFYRAVAGQPRRIDCTMAGRFHCYAYSWDDLPQLPNAPRTRELQYLCVVGYRNGYGGHSGLPDDFQSPAIFGLPATLEMAASRAMGPEYTLQHLHCQRPPAGYRCATWYQSLGPGSSIAVCRVVDGYPTQLRMYSNALSPMPRDGCHVSSVNRMSMDDNGYRSYSFFTFEDEHAKRSSLSPNPPVSNLGFVVDSLDAAADDRNREEEPVY